MQDLLDLVETHKLIRMRRAAAQGGDSDLLDFLEAIKLVAKRRAGRSLPSMNVEVPLDMIRAVHGKPFTARGDDLEAFVNQEEVETAALLYNHIQTFLETKDQANLFLAGYEWGRLESMITEGSWRAELHSRLLASRGRKTRKSDVTQEDRTVIIEEASLLKKINPTSSKSSIAETIRSNPQIQRRLSREYSVKTLLRVIDGKKT